MDQRRPAGPYLAVGCALPLYTISNIITTIAGGVNYGWRYYLTLPGALGFLPVLTWTAIFRANETEALYRKIIALIRRITGRNR